MTTIPPPVLDADQEAAFEAAAEALAGDPDRLFDLRMLHAKVRLGLPVGRPESLSDVPRERRAEIEQAYREAGREAGQSLLDRGEVAPAWSYFQAIGEPGPVREAIAAAPLPRPDEAFDEAAEDLTRLALYEGANPPRGVERMLRSTGTCGTVTALDQLMPQLPAEDRPACAAVMVRHLHGELLRSVRADVERTAPLLTEPTTVAELFAGRESLLSGGGYHIDVSHLSAVVRFARSLEPGDAELPLAVDLCAYGRRLDRSLQYPGEPPFGDFYVSHGHFLRALAGEGVDEAVGYFEGKLRAEPDLPDRRLIAYVLSDLLMRCGRAEAAVATAAEHLAGTAAETGFSLAEMCERAGRLDLLATHAAEAGDVVGVLAGRFGART